MPSPHCEAIKGEIKKGSALRTSQPQEARRSFLKASISLERGHILKPDGQAGKPDVLSVALNIDLNSCWMVRMHGHQETL